MSYEITRWFEIDAGHRVPKHESKCKNLHGHRYKIGFVLKSDELDPVGRVRDFGAMKDEYGPWLDYNWDHGMILQASDPWVARLAGAADGLTTKMYVMKDPPTAECMAKHLYEEFFDTNVMRVIVYETPNCCAVYPTSD